MASNPASRRNSISASWPVFPPRPEPPAKMRGIKGKLKVYESPSPAPFLAQMGTFDFLLPAHEGVSPMPTYAGCLPAIIEGGRSISREELRSLSLKLAGGLTVLGVQKGDIAVVSAEGVEGSVALMAMLAAGIVASPIVPDVELRHQLSDSRPRLVFLSPTQLSAFEAANAHLDRPIPDDHVILLTPPPTPLSFDLTPQRYRSLYDILSAEEATPAPLNGAACSAPAVRIYTPSGRAVTISHQNLVSQLSSASPELGPSDTLLVAPGAPFIASLLPLALGAGVTHSASLSALERSEATMAWLPPPALSRLIDRLRARDGEDRELCLRTVISSGAQLGSLGRKLERILPDVRVLPAYCAAEAGVVVMHADDPDATVGLLAPGLQARLVQNDGTDAPVGGKGELWLRGPSVSTTDHWHRTGDIASVRHGRWTIHGRLDARFDSHATPVCPERLEALLLRHPAVRDAAVGPGPDGVRAYLVMDGGVQNVMRYVQGRTRKPKWVRSVVLVDQIPRTASGRVRRDRLGGGEVVRYEPEKWARM